MNWKVIGGIVVGLLLVVAGLGAAIGTNSVTVRIGGEIWIGVGALFLALIAFSAWRGR